MDEYSLNIAKMNNSSCLILKFFKETCLNNPRMHFAVSILIGGSLNGVSLLPVAVPDKSVSMLESTEQKRCFMEFL